MSGTKSRKRRRGAAVRNTPPADRGRSSRKLVRTIPRLGALVLAVSVFGLAATALVIRNDNRPDEPAAPEVSVPAIPATAMEPRVHQRMQAVRDAVVASPSSGEAWGQYGIVCDAHALYEAAAVCYRQAHELAPKDFRWPYFLAWVLDVQGAEPDEVVSLFKVAAGLQPGYAPLFARLGDALVRQGLLAEAKQAYESAISLEDNLGAAYRGLGQVLLMMNQPERAVTSLERAAKILPRDRAVFAGLANAYARLGRGAAAKETAGAIGEGWTITLLPDPARNEVILAGISANLCTRRADDYMQAGLYEAALLDLKIAAETRPDDPSIHRRLAHAYLRLGLADKAVEHFNAALAFREDPEARVQLAAILTQQRRFDDAARHYRSAASHEPQDADIQAALGSVMARKGELEEALAAFQHAQALGPLKASAYNDWGVALLQRGDADGAGRRFREALELDPGFANAHFNLGTILERQGRIEEAVSHYESAVKIAPQHPAAERLRSLRDSFSNRR